MMKVLIILFLISELHFCEENNLNSSKLKPELRLTYLDSEIKDIRWCGKTSKESLLALTEKGSVYKSVDKGFHWRKLNEIFYKISTDSNDTTKV